MGVITDLRDIEVECCIPADGTDAEGVAGHGAFLRLLDGCRAANVQAVVVEDCEGSLLALAPEPVARLIAALINADTTICPRYAAGDVRDPPTALRPDGTKFPGPETLGEAIRRLPGAHAAKAVANLYGGHEHVWLQHAAPGRWWLSIGRMSQNRCPLHFWGMPDNLPLGWLRLDRASNTWMDTVYDGIPS